MQRQQQLPKYVEIVRDATTMYRTLRDQEMTKAKRKGRRYPVSDPFLEP
jgi:hypothetical protein